MLLLSRLVQCQRFILLAAIIGCQTQALPHNLLRPFHWLVQALWQDKLAQAPQQIQKEGWLAADLLTVIEKQLKSPAVSSISLGSYAPSQCIDLCWYTPKSRQYYVNNLRALFNQYDQATEPAAKQTQLIAIHTYLKKHASAYSTALRILKHRAQAKALRRTYITYIAPAVAALGCTLIAGSTAAGIHMLRCHVSKESGKSDQPIPVINAPLEKNKKRIVNTITEKESWFRKFPMTVKPTVWIVMVNNKRIETGEYVDIATDTFDVIHECKFIHPITGEDKGGKRKLSYKLPPNTNEAAICFNVWDPTRKVPALKVTPGTLIEDKIIY